VTLHEDAEPLQRRDGEPLQNYIQRLIKDGQSALFNAQREVRRANNTLARLEWCVGALRDEGIKGRDAVLQLAKQVQEVFTPCAEVEYDDKTLATCQTKFEQLVDFAPADRDVSTEQFLKELGVLPADVPTTNCSCTKPAPPDRLGAWWGLRQGWTCRICGGFVSRFDVNPAAKHEHGSR
jgi:hypothetical protein